jgi:succinoglycan biosynthesis transport protein ExoP
MQQLPEPPNAREKKRVVPATYTEIPYAKSYEPEAEPEAGEFIEYGRILRRRKGTLILIASLGAVIGFLVTIPQTPIYQARTSLEIFGINTNFLNMKQVDPITQTGTSADTSDIQTQIKILQSDTLIDSVVAKLKSPALAQAYQGRPALWRKIMNLPDPEPTDPREQELTYAKKNFNVRAAGQTRIVQITVDSSSPQTAAAFANTLTDEFINQSLESRWKTTERTREFLTRQIDDMRIRLESSEDTLQRYAGRAGLVFTNEDKTNVSEAKLQQVQQALSAAQTDRIAKQSRWEMANSSPAEALPDVLNDPNLRDYQLKLTELNRQLAELSSTYTQEHAKVKRVQAQIATLQPALDRERSDILKRIRNEYSEALRREKLLAAEYGAQRGVVTGEGERAVQYNILKREVESSRQLYDAMLQQLKQSSLASALRASNVRVVDPAKLPKKPYKPDIPLSSGLGLLSGILLGSAFVIMRERVDRSIQEPGESMFYMNLPELGIIPSERLGPRVRLRIVSRKELDAETTPQPSVPAVRERVELATSQRKPSMVAESFRSTVVSILFSGENGSRPRVMVVSSCSPAEGKSTVVSNLGIAVAEVDQKVLLIDADLRKPRLHDIFELKNDRGLSDLLRSKDSLGALPEGIIQETSVPDLYVLTSGSTTAAAASLLFSSRMPELLKKLRAEFETIFIDTPPMLQIPDARVLGRMADRVILVVRAGKTTRDAALAARQRFSEDGTQILGTILNDWNPKLSPNGYYGHYNGDYYGRYQNGYGHCGHGKPEEPAQP